MRPNRFYRILFAVLALFLFASCLAAAAEEPELAEKAEEHAEADPLHLALETAADAFSQDMLQFRQIWYDQAVELLYTRQFSEAYDIFEDLGDYLDSGSLAAFCESYPASEPVFEEPLICEDAVDAVYFRGTLYKYPEGRFYIPNTVSASTSFLVYYSGGPGDGDFLYYRGLYPYFETYYPDSIMLFVKHSGIRDMEQSNRDAMAILQELAKETGVIVHDVSSMGSSMGCYTALKAAPVFFEEYGIPVQRVCTMDAGEEWKATQCPTWYDCDLAAKAGTVFYLFEQPNVGMGKDAIRTMVEHGVETWVVNCFHSDHDKMSVNAYTNGIFSWCAGKLSSLPSSEYVFVRMKEGMEKYGPVTWGEEPVTESEYLAQDKAILNGE